MKQREFRRMWLAAVTGYLTGWPIAQAIYHRVVKHYRDTTWEDEKRDIAAKVVDAVAEHLDAVLERMPVPSIFSLPEEPQVEAVRGLGYCARCQMHHQRPVAITPADWCFNHPVD